MAQLEPATFFLNSGEGPQQIAVSGRPTFGHFATQLEECVDAIVVDRAPSISGDDGLRLLQQVLMLYQY